MWLLLCLLSCVARVPPHPAPVAVDRRFHGEHPLEVPIWVGEPGDEAGRTVALGEVDGEALVGAPYANRGAGSVILLGPDREPLRIDGSEPGELLGRALAVADLDEDGSMDLVLGAPGRGDGAGGVAWFAGPLTASGGLDWLLAGEGTDRVGQALAACGDLDGDGHGDLVLGAPTGGGEERGLALLLRGPWDGSPAPEAVRLTGAAARDYAGSALVGGGDLDGDGVADLVVGAFGAGGGAPWQGAAYVVLGPISADRSLADADTVLTGLEAWDLAAWSLAVAGDANGDGLGDLWVSAHGSDLGGLSAGAAYLVLGPGGGGLAGAAATLFGESEGAAAGWSLVAGDLDGDAHPDVVIGGPTLAGPEPGAGGAWVVYGPVSGARGLGRADARLVGQEGAAQAGFSLALATGPAGATLLVGAPYAGGGERVGGGAVFLMPLR